MLPASEKCLSKETQDFLAQYFLPIGLSQKKIITSGLMIVHLDESFEQVSTEANYCTKLLKMLVFQYQDQWVHLLVHPVHRVCHALEHKQQSDTHFHLSEELWHQIQTSVA